MPSVADLILFVVSARGVMPWGAFKAALDYLYTVEGSGELDLASARSARQQTVQNLRALGHCDFDFSALTAQVYSGPSILVRLPFAGEPEAILCGGRTPRAIGRVADAGRVSMPRCEVIVEQQPASRHTVPSRVLIRSSSISGIEDLARRLGVPFSRTPAAWQFAHLAPSLEAVSNLMHWREVAEPNWPAQVFDLRSCRFGASPVPAQVEGPKLVSYRDPRTGQPLVLAWDGVRSAKVDRTWGRFWLMSRVRARVLAYDERRLTLMVPAVVPLPALHLRALSLCSGVPATEVNDAAARGTRVSFRNVPTSIARLILDKLGQS